MAAVLDFSKFTFSPEQIRAVNELVFDEILEAPEIELLCTVFPGIVSDKEMGFIGEGGLVGVANQGCDPVPQDWNIATRKLVWTPTDWEILIAECWKDLKSTAAVYSLKTKVDIADFTSTDYMNIVVEVLTMAMKKFIMRLFWFNDTDAENVTDGGIITNGVAIKYFTILDGFWKQLLTQVTANPAQRVTIAENAGTTYALQALVIANITGVLQSLIYKAPLHLRNNPSGFIACTQSVYDAYMQAQQSLSGIKELYVNLTNGMKTLTVGGVPLIPMPIWDEMIAQFENTGVKLNNPHRALYTTKEVLGIGVDDIASFGTLDIRYDKESRKVKIEAMGVADAKIMNPVRFELAI